MIVLVHTDHHIENNAGLTARINSVVDCALGHRSDHITRVEVHVSDVNGATKGGARQMRCVMEARVEGRGALAVTNHAANLNDAVDGAADKLVRHLGHTLGRAHDVALHST